MGLFLSFESMVTTMIDHAPADLWIVPLGTKCFEDTSLLDERERFRAMAVEGVSDAVPILISFAQWRVPTGGTVPVLVIGSNPWTRGLHPWNILEGSLDSLAIPDAVAIDRSYSERLGSKGLGDTAEIRDQARRCRWSLRVSARLRPRPMYSRCWIGRVPIRGRPRTRPPICCSILPLAPTLKMFAAD